MTNGDRIRQMSNEKLAEVLSGNCTYCAFQFLEGKTIDFGIGKCRDLKCAEGIKAYLDKEEE